MRAIFNFLRFKSNPNQVFIKINLDLLLEHETENLNKAAMQRFVRSLLPYNSGKARVQIILLIVNICKPTRVYYTQLKREEIKI